MKELADPMMAKIHIQNTAPGPPMTMAVATPAILPTPIRAPIPMQNASNDDTCLVDFPSLTPEKERVEVSLILVIWRPLSLTVKMRPSPMRKTKAMPQKYELTWPTPSITESNSDISLAPIRAGTRSMTATRRFGWCGPRSIS